MSDVRNVYPLHFLLWSAYSPTRGLPRQVLFHLPSAIKSTMAEDLLAAACAHSTTFKRAVAVVKCTPAETAALRHVCEFDEDTCMRRPLPSHYLTLPIVSNPDRVEDLEEDTNGTGQQGGFMRETLRARYREREAAKELYYRLQGKGEDGVDTLLHKMDAAIATHLQKGADANSAQATTSGVCQAVLQGAYGCADDCSNILPNATLFCESIRDIWRLLQHSDKMASDMCHQRISSPEEPFWIRGPAVLGRAYQQVVEEEKKDERAASGGDMILRLSLMESVPESSDFRAFVLVTSEGSTYIGACQKRVEAVYDAHVDCSFEDRRTASNCIERAMSRLFDSEVAGGYGVAPKEGAATEVDDAILLSPTHTLASKLNMLCARGLFGPDVDAVMVGVDISFESGSLPLYVFGMDVLPLTTSEADAFLKPSIYPTGSLWSADRVPFCRLFRTLGQLKTMFRRSEDMATGDAVAEGDDDAPCNDPFLFFVARGEADIFGDIKLVTNHQQYTATGDAGQHYQLKLRLVGLELAIRAAKEACGIEVPAEVPKAPATGGQGDEGVAALIGLMQKVAEKEAELALLVPEASA